MRFRSQTVFALTLLLSLSCSVSAQAYPPAGQVAVDPLLRLNGAFRSAYADARRELLSQAGPVIVARGDGLLLLMGERQVTGTTVDPAYHDLKTIAHVPLAIYVLLAPYGPGEIDAERLANLAKLYDLVADARRVAGRNLKDQQLINRQRRLLQACSQFIEQACKQQRYSADALEQLIRDTLPQVNENVTLAVRLRLDNYHRQAMAWRTTLSADEWSQLRVVIPGAPMPRANNLAVQYFAKLLGEPGEGARIVYAESLFAQSQAMDLLGTHLLDTKIGEAFYQDPWRMRRDLLGPATAVYLDELDFSVR